jgi:hypothetical protein
MLPFEEDDVKRKTRKALNITADHAARALHALIADGKLAARDVLTALKRREKLIKELRDRFTALESEAVPAVAQAREAVALRSGRKRARPSGAKAKARSKSAAAARVRASRDVAGRTRSTRSTRGKSSTPTVGNKPAAARTAKRLAGTGARPAPVKATTKTVSKKTSIMTEPKPRPRSSVPARRADGHALPDPGNPEFEARGPVPPQL